MLVEDGRRLLISNLPLQDLAFIQGKALMADDEQTLRDQYRGYNPTKPEPDLYDLEYPDLASVSAVELFGLFGEAGRDNLKLASAVRMSATFPYVTSAVALPTDPPRHAVDAGYYDNYGINLATAWVFSHRAWIARNTSGVLVVQSRAFRNEKRLKILSEDIHDSASNDELESHEWISVAKVAHFLPALASLVADGVRSLVLPLEGLAQARDSSMYFRNDEQLRGLQRMFADLGKDEDFFRSFIFTCDTIQVGQEAQNAETLNWYIDPLEFDRIRRNLEPYKKLDRDARTVTGRDRNDMRVQSVLAWWAGREAKARAGAGH